MNGGTHYRAKMPSYRNQSIRINSGLQWVEIDGSSKVAMLHEAPLQIFSRNKTR